MQAALSHFLCCLSWARALGLKVLCGGNLHEFRYSAEEGTLSPPWGGSPRTVPPESRRYLARIPEGQAPRYVEARHGVTATRDLRAGEVASGPGQSSTDPNLRATLIPAARVADDSPLPFFLLEGNTLATDWPKGTLLTRRMVVAPSSSTLWPLRQQQDQVFLAGREAPARTRQVAASSDQSRPPRHASPRPASSGSSKPSGTASS